jgi:cyclopropane fatty-acyl-phospholipid synthase-like methyltransferase
MIIDPSYQNQLSTMHGRGQFRNSGSKMLKNVQPVIKQYQPKSLLDFGCGHGALITSIQELYPTMHVEGYDPGNPAYTKMPRSSFDVVVSADVFEHIEPKYLNETLELISNKIQKAGWFRIACYPAKKHLPDGRNAHLIVELPDWWRTRILDVMKLNIVKEDISVIDKSHKWPDVKGHNYDVTVEVK